MAFYEPASANNAGTNGPIVVPGTTVHSRRTLLMVAGGAHIAMGRPGRQWIGRASVELTRALWDDMMPRLAPTSGRGVGATRWLLV